MPVNAEPNGVSQLSPTAKKTASFLIFVLLGTTARPRFPAFKTSNLDRALPGLPAHQHTNSEAHVNVRVEILECGVQIVPE